MPVYGKKKIKMSGSKPYGQRGHVLPSTYIHPIYKNTKLRTKHVLHFAKFSHATLYRKITAGLFPPPDTKGGPRCWKVATLLAYLEKYNSAAAAELAVRIKGEVMPVPDFMTQLDRQMGQAKNLSATPSGK